MTTSIERTAEQDPELQARRERVAEEHKDKICGLMCVRGDDWCIGLSMRVALTWCNCLIVLFDDRVPNDPVNNLAFTLAQEAKSSCGDRVLIMRRTDTKYDEVKTRMTMLEKGRELGYGCFGLIDADEVASPALVNASKRIIYSKPGESFAARMIAPWDGLDNARTGGSFDTSWITFAFRDGPNVGWSNDPDGYGYHRRNPCDPKQEIKLVNPGVLVAHLQYANLARLRWKAVWYKAMERLRFPGRMTDAQLDTKYDWWLKADGTKTTDFKTWWPRLIERHLKIHPQCWQRHELIGWIMQAGFSEDRARRIDIDEGIRRVCGSINTHGLDLAKNVDSDIEHALEYDDPMKLLVHLPTH